MGKKYSFISYVTNPINFTLIIKKITTAANEFNIRYKTTYNFIAYIEKFSSAVGWILKLKVPKIKITGVLKFILTSSASLKINKIRILINDSGITSITQTLKINKFFINAIEKLTEKWSQSLRINKIVLTNISVLLGRLNSLLKINKITFTANLQYAVYPFLSYYDSEYLDGYLNSMDISYLSDLDSIES